MGWEEKAAKAKRGHRPSLKNWSADNLATTFPPYAHHIINSHYPYRSFKIKSISTCEKKRGSSRSRVVEKSLSIDELRDCAKNHFQYRNLGRIRYDGSSKNDNNTNNVEEEIVYPIVLDAAITPPKEFHERYEAKCIPVVIRNIPYGASSSCSSYESENGNGSSRSSSHHYRNNNNSNDGDHSMEEEKKECDHHHHSHHDNAAHHAAAARQQKHQHDNKFDKSKQWPAVTKWSLDALKTDPDLSDRPLKCGEDDDGYTIRMKLSYFLQYLNHNTDDSPLYIFDATFDEDKGGAKVILDHYTVPEYFNEDLLGLVGERRRPPYRWFLVGPCRSGTTVHIDPLGTSAWNTLLHGVKRWVLFPPHVPKGVVKGRKLILPGEDDEAIHYFTTILPRMKRRAAAACGGGDKGEGEYANFECYEFTQYAGETVFIPHGWWHAVLNVTHTVGITQNYCSRRNFDEVWCQTRSGRKKMVSS